MRKRSSPTSDFLLRAFADVKPLEKRGRVPPPIEPPRPPEAYRRERALVMEQDDDYVAAYRAELGGGALRSLRSKSWEPQHVVDLHGRRVEGLAAELGRELRVSARRGIRRLLIVHGKGLHSEEGVAVLRDAVVEILSERRAAEIVRAFATAPRRLGGSGALAVELDAPARQPR